MPTERNRSCATSPTAHGARFCYESCGLDRRIVWTLKTAWADGTTDLVFEPVELLVGQAAGVSGPVN